MPLPEDQVYHIPEESAASPPAWSERDLRTGRRRLLKKKLLVYAALVVFCVLLFGAALARFIPAAAPENPLDYDPVTLEPKPPEGFLKKIGHFVFSKDITLDGERDDRMNILLLGIGGAGHDGPYLTDTLMIASLKPSTGHVALISIPRDLLVAIPEKGQQKINHANAFGEVKKTGWGGALATEVVEDTFDIDIHYYIRVDFQAFKEVVDAVGGITVNVERSFHDPLYPAPNFAYQTVSFARGAQTMDGKTALQYARSRHGSNGEGSDFARSRRQQKVLLALKEKALSATTLTNPIRIKNILDTLDTHITTNMEFAEMLALMKMARTFSGNALTTLTLDTSETGYLEPGVSPDGAFVLVPKSGSFREIHDAMQNIFDNAPTRPDDTPVQIALPDTPTPAVNIPVEIEIQNGTWYAGLAARMKKRLTDASFPIGPIGNTNTRPQPVSAVYVLTPAAPSALVDALTAELRMPVKNALPEGIVPGGAVDILIVLGEDIEQ